MSVIECAECRKFVSKANISRHRKRHGVMPCQKCIHKTLEPKAQILGMRFWFSSFQQQLMACNLLDRMVHLRNLNSPDELDSIPIYYLKAIYEAALLDIGCPWSRQDYVSKYMWRLIRERVYDKRCICWVHDSSEFPTLKTVYSREKKMWSFKCDNVKGINHEYKRTWNWSTTLILKTELPLLIQFHELAHEYGECVE